MTINSHFSTLKYSPIMYTVLFSYVAHYLNNKSNKTGLKEEQEVL